MQVISESDVEGTEAVDGVHLKLLAGGEHENVQHFTIEPGATVPAHSHPHEQVGYMLSGELTFTVDGDEHVLEPGDSYVIPGDETHAAANHGDTPAVGLDVFSPPRDDPDWQD